MKRFRNDKIRTGFIGVGNRGRGHLRTCFGMDKVEITAICDISERYLSDAKKLISGANLPEPAIYTGSEESFLEMLENEELDAVIFTKAIVFCLYLHLQPKQEV